MALRPSFRLRAGAFDLAVALFAAGSIGFAAFAMPEWRLNALLEASGLPQILPAARPPLGLTARLGSAALFAIAAFGGVLTLMRLLDRISSPKAKGPAEEEVPFEPMIRLRRSDAHPDNPARRPLVAGRELGEPFDELVLRKPDRAERNEEPTAGFGRAHALPAFLTPDDAPLPAASVGDAGRNDEEVVDYDELPEEAFEPSSTIEDVAAPDPLSPAFRPVVADSDHAEPAPEFAPGPAAFDDRPEPAAFDDRPEPEAFDDVAAPLPAEPQPVDPMTIEAPAAPVAADPSPVAPAVAENGEESITALMARLDAGLRRREQSPPVGSPPAAPVASGGDDIAGRLRNAVTDLQKLTARG